MYPCKVLVMDDMDTHSLKYSAECPVDLLQDLFRAHVQLKVAASRLLMRLLLYMGTEAGKSIGQDG